MIFVWALSILAIISFFLIFTCLDHPICVFVLFGMSIILFSRAGLFYKNYAIITPLILNSDVIVPYSTLIHPTCTVITSGYDTKDEDYVPYVVKICQINHHLRI